MKLTITIDCGNAAFDDIGCGPEVARILRTVAAEVDGFNKVGVRQEADGLKLHDYNGNSVGIVKVTR